MPSYHENEPTPEPHISKRDWTLCVLEERARAHLGQICTKSPPELEQGRPSEGSIDPSSPPPEGCHRCGSTALFLDEARPLPMLTCGSCLAPRPAQAREKRRAQICAVHDRPIGPPSLPMRVALYLRGLLATATDNEARP